MVFKTLNGRERNVPTKQYHIDWSPVREVSSWQAAAKAFLRPYWENDVVFEEFLIDKRMRVDLLNINKAVMVEVSPESSHSYNAFFHRGSLNRFKDALKRDLAKQRWAEVNQFAYVELTDTDFPLTPEAFARQGVIL
jgi:hypothetical protein